VPEEVRAFYDRTEKGKQDEDAWKKLLAEYLEKNSDVADIVKV
jgi:hypothetical protein